MANILLGKKKAMQGGNHMKLSVRGKSMDVTPALQQYVEKHTDKIQRYFDKEIVLHVLLSVTKNTQKAEATMQVDGIFIRAVEKSADMYRSIDVVFDKLERQIHKYKTRLAKRFKGRQVLNDKFLTPHTPAGNEAESESFEVVRHKSFDMKPMSTEEAILQMSLLDHDFFVFKNEETDLISVIYKRDDGKYGIIETKE